MRDIDRVVFLIEGPVRGHGILSGRRPGGKSKIGTMAGFEIRLFVHWGRIAKKGYCESWTICSEDGLDSTGHDDFL